MEVESHGISLLSLPTVAYDYFSVDTLVPEMCLVARMSVYINMDFFELHSKQLLKFSVCCSRSPFLEVL